MKIARILNTDNQPVYVTTTDNPARLIALNGDPLRQPLDTIKPTNQVFTTENIQWLPPVSPAAILCIGLNYHDHIKEGFGREIPKEPVLFMKNPSAANAHLQPIRIPAVCDDEVDYEGELAVVISRACKNIPIEKALDYVLGYCPANDVTARIWQNQRGGTQWCRAKGFDTFAPLGPFITTTDELSNSNNLTIETRLNDQIVQQGNTAEMIFSVPTLISFLSQDTTLQPGTVILTGTPCGIGWARQPRLTLHHGDTVTVTIQSLGTLCNPVQK